MTLSQLSDQVFVNQLPEEQRQLCWAAVRTALDRELKYGILPRTLTATPVNVEVEEDVRSFLSTRGWSRDKQPDVLTIGDARVYIGRWVKRLLECIPTPRLGRPPLAPEPHMLTLITPPPWFRPSSKAPAPARQPRDPAEKRVPREPKLTRMPRRALKKALRRESLDERYWPENRLHQSEAVHLLDAQGLAVTAQDPRLGRFVVLLNRRMPLTGQSLHELRTLAAAEATTLAMIDELASAIAQANEITAAEEVRELAIALMPSRQPPQSTVAKADLIVPRYGAEGRVLTLNEIGERHQLTRERARQVQEIFEARLSAGAVYAPRLEAVRRTLAGIDFALLEPLQQQLTPELGTMALEGALDLMDRVLEWPVGGRIAYARRNALAPELALWTQSLSETAVSSVMQQAAAMSSSVGAFLVTGIIGLVAEHAQRFVTREQIHQVLSAWPPAHWIDEETGWGWIDGVERGSMITDVRRILAVAQPVSVDIAVIYAGLTQPKRAAARAEHPNRFSGLMAPRWVLQHVLGQLPEFAVAQYDNFRLRTPVDPRTVMEDGTEIAIYDALVKRGGLATWQQLKQDLVQTQGVNPITFGVVLKNRCWIEQPGYGLYCLRGLRLHIEQVRANGRVHAYLPPVLPASGLLPLDRRTGLSMLLRQTSVARETTPHRVINIPHRFHAAIVPGEYRHSNGAGRVITVGPTQVSRLPNELTDAGVGPGESVLLTLDTQNKTYAWKRADVDANSADPG